MFQFHKQASKPDETYLQLVENLTQTKIQLDIAYQNFENAVEPELIDCYIYEVNAIQMRYKFLLSRLKSYQMTDTKIE